MGNLLPSQSSIKTIAWTLVALGVIYRVRAARDILGA